MTRWRTGACWAFAAGTLSICASVSAAPAVVVRGRVLDADGKPVAGVLVHAFCDADGAQIDRDAKRESLTDGSFEIGDVPPGAVFVMVFPGKADDERHATTAERAVFVRAGETPPEVVLRLRPFATPVAVRLLDERGKPVPGVSVQGAGKDVTVTGADGVAQTAVKEESFGNPPRVRLSGGPVGTTPVNAPLCRGPAGGTRFDLVVAEPTTLRLRVVFPNGRIREDEHAQVVLDAEPAQLVCGPTSMQRGDIVVPRSHAFRLILENRTELGVHRAEEAKDGFLEVRIGRGTSVHGKFAPPADGVKAPVRVEAVGEGDLAPDPILPPNEWGEVSGDTFHFAGLAKGRWAIFVFRDFRKGDRFVAKRIEVSGDGDVDLGDLSARPTVRGVVRRDGKPLAGARVGIQDAHGPAFLAMTDADGRYVLQLPGGADGALFAYAAGCGLVGRAIKSAVGGTLDFELPAETHMIIRNACDALHSPLRVTIRSGGEFESVQEAPFSGGDIVLGKLAPGPVDLLFVDGSGQRIVHAGAAADSTTEVDLAK